VPELSRFYGIIIRMFYGDHPPPHFHAVTELRQAWDLASRNEEPSKIQPLD
jgi:uncharacterized protein DUF4160